MNLKQIVAKLKPYIYLYDLIGVFYVITALILSAIYAFKLDFKMVLNWHYDLKFFKLSLVFILLDSCWIAINLNSKSKRKKIFNKEWWALVKDKYLTPLIIWHLVKVLFWLKVILLIYCNIKQAIPFINPQLYDKELLKIDKFFAFGLNPSAYSVSVCSSHIMSGLVDKLYILWYLIKPLILIYFVITKSKLTHIRFFSCYFSMWIVGGLLALILPSLGPIYVHPEWFASLFKPFADGLQERLGVHYLLAKANPADYKYFIYEGIAAFPSLHVGIIAIFAFFVKNENRTFGTLLFIYLAIIQFGSVLLGWHYMVDGIFAIIMAYLMYKLSIIYPKKNSSDTPTSEIMPGPNPEEDCREISIH